MRTRSVITLALVLVVGLFSALAFAAPLAGARPTPSSAQANDDTTAGAIRADALPHHDDAPRQAGRRSGERVDTKQQEGDNIAAPTTRFATITVTIDPKGVPLAAYQFEVTAGHAFTVVGLDNAGHPAFSDPPHYDRAAAAGGTDRLIVADYSTKPVGQLLAKPQAAAVIHAAFLVDEETDLEALAASVALTLTAAADADGNRIDADITYEIHLAERPGQE